MDPFAAPDTKTADILKGRIADGSRELLQLLAKKRMPEQSNVLSNRPVPQRIEGAVQLTQLPLLHLGHTQDILITINRVGDVDWEEGEVGDDDDEWEDASKRKSWTRTSQTRTFPKI